MLHRPPPWEFEKSRAVLRLVKCVASTGTAVVVISHVLPHVIELADRVIVMRHGRVVATIREHVELDELISLIVGAGPADRLPPSFDIGTDHEAKIQQKWSR